MLLRISVGAFLNNPESAAAVEALKEDRLFLRSSIESHEGGIDAARAFLADNPTPALLIVESGAQGDALYEQLGALADVCAPGTQVILIGTQNDVELYRNLIKEGVADYLIGPVADGQLKTSIADIFKDKDIEKTARLIALAAWGAASYPTTPPTSWPRLTGTKLSWWIWIYRMERRPSSLICSPARRSSTP